MSAPTTNSHVTSVTVDFGVQAYNGRFWSVDNRVSSFEADGIARLLDFDTVEQAIAHAQACQRAVDSRGEVLSSLPPTVRLRNGAKVLKALVVPGPGTDRDRLEVGYVLAETDHDFVVWHIYRWLVGKEATETFHAEHGRYVPFWSPEDAALAKDEALVLFEEKSKRYVRRG
jgi:hypothetical protein